MTEQTVNRRGNRRGMNPKSRENLALGQFKKGEVSNPRGRPKNELSITNLTREMLTAPCPLDSKGRTWKEYIVDKWLELAAENPAYFRELIERIEGRTPLLVSQESRNVTIVVQDEETRQLFEHVGDRTAELASSANSHFIIGRGEVSEEEFDAYSKRPKPEAQAEQET